MKNEGFLIWAGWEGSQFPMEMEWLTHAHSRHTCARAEHPYGHWFTELWKDRTKTTAKQTTLFPPERARQKTSKLNLTVGWVHFSCKCATFFSWTGIINFTWGKHSEQVLESNYKPVPFVEYFFFKKIPLIIVIWQPVVPIKAVAMSELH